MTNFRLLFIVLVFSLIQSLSGQTNAIEIPFSTDNGYEGIVQLQSDFYFEDTYKVDLTVQKVLITGYATSIGYFSSNDLSKQGITFPVPCEDCSFTINGEVMALFFDKEETVNIPFNTSNILETNSIMTLTIPFKIPKNIDSFNQYKSDWTNLGKLTNCKIQNLNGSLLKKLVSTVRLVAKIQADQSKLTTLIEEISELESKESLSKLYQSRNYFYDKTQIDSLISVVQNGTFKKETELTQIAEPIIVSVEVKKKTSQIESPKEISTENIQIKSQSQTIDDSATQISELNIPVASSEIPTEKIIEPQVEKQVQPVAETPKETNSSLNALVAITNSENVEANSSLSEIIEAKEEPTSFLAALSETANAAKKDIAKKDQKRKKSKRVSKLSNNDFDFSSDLSKYKRSSLHTIMLRNPGAEQAEVIEETFLNRPLPEKFNGHHISTNFISVSKKKRKQDKIISEYLNRNHVAKALVAKWFNRNEKGEFNMDLIAERGHYNASVFDLNIARKSERGLAMLSDAGEQLIANTFIIVNDYKYTNKEEVAKKASFITRMVSIAADAAGASDVARIADAATLTTVVAGKGYVVKVTSYLYRLKWDENIANTFYETYWVDANSFDATKKSAFDRTDFFELELLGYETDFSGVQSTAFTSKSDAELIERATIKATDQTISKLQRKFEIFRTKTPLISTQPLAAKIGLKEGLEKGDKFEVLEQALNDDGTIVFNRVGVIKVDKNHIWDNRYGALEENKSSYEYTSFSGSKNKFYQGMLIRQIN